MPDRQPLTTEEKRLLVGDFFAIWEAVRDGKLTAIEAEALMDRASIWPWKKLIAAIVAAIAFIGIWKGADVAVESTKPAPRIEIVVPQK